MITGRARPLYLESGVKRESILSSLCLYAALIDSRFATRAVLKIAS